MNETTRSEQSYMGRGDEKPTVLCEESAGILGVAGLVGVSKESGIRGSQSAKLRFGGSWEIRETVRGSNGLLACYEVGRNSESKEKSGRQASFRLMHSTSTAAIVSLTTT